MKPDTTSAERNLSRKIRTGFIQVIFLILLLNPLLTSAEQSLITTYKYLKSIPSGELVIIDTRSKLKYLLGHIPNALHIGNWENYTHTVKGVRGLLKTEPDFIINKLKPYGIDKNKTIILYGEPTDPWREDGRFFWMFERFGFDKILILEGGVASWQSSGGNLEFGSNRQTKSSSLTQKDITLNPLVSADQKWISKRLKSKELVIIDNRTRAEYDGKIPYGSPRGGHIPSAIHIHWPEFFSTNGYLKNKKELSKILSKYDINHEKEIVVYCTGGIRSAMAYFVLRTLDYKVRNYDGSWWDWSQNLKLSIE